MKGIILIGLFCIILFTSTALGGYGTDILQVITSDTLDETRTINVREYLVYSFVETGGDKMNVDINVINGGAIDVFLMDSLEFTKFQSMMLGGSSRESQPLISGKNVKSKSFKHTFQPTNSKYIFNQVDNTLQPSGGGDRYYIVIDNTELPDNGATPSGVVDVNIKITKEKAPEVTPVSIPKRKEILQEITLDASDEIRTIKVDEYLVYYFRGYSDVKMNVDINVINGGAIDVFLMDSLEFTKFQSMMLGGSSSGFRPLIIGKNVKSKSFINTFYYTDSYYIVIDNTVQPNDGATPSGVVDVNIKITKEKAPEATPVSTPSIIPTTTPLTTPGFEAIYSILIFSTVFYLFRTKLKP